MRTKLEGALNSRRRAALFALAFLFVFREGFETVLFYQWGPFAPRFQEELSPEFADRWNPLDGVDAATANRRIFQENGATCHGARAESHGPAATGLVPSPVEVRTGEVLTQHSDACLYYGLSTGKPGTAMRSFRGLLDENERWQVITYLRLRGRAALTPASSVGERRRR